MVSHVTVLSEGWSRMAAAESFDAFFARTCPGLLARALMFCGHRQDAEDAVQNAYIAAFKAWDRINEEYESPEAWLYTVLRNELSAQARKRAKERSVAEAIPVPNDPTPEQTAEAMAVLEALAALPPKQRAAIVLHRLFGLPQEEVATRLGVRRNTVAVNVRNARHTLERLLDLRPIAGESPRDPLVARGRLPRNLSIVYRDPLDAKLRAAERWLREAFEDSPESAERVRAAISTLLGDAAFPQDTAPRDTPSNTQSATSSGDTPPDPGETAR